MNGRCGAASPSKRLRIPRINPRQDDTFDADHQLHPRRARQRVVSDRRGDRGRARPSSGRKGRRCSSTDRRSASSRCASGSPSGRVCAVDRVLTGNGSLQLIEFLCLHMLKPGDVVFTEAPTYDRTITLLRRHGAKVVGIPLEADGPDIEALERALAKQRAEVLLHHPRLPEPGRRDLLGSEAAADRGAGRAARIPDRRRRAVPSASLSRHARSRRSTSSRRSARCT